MKPSHPWLSRAEVFGVLLMALYVLLGFWIGLAVLHVLDGEWLLTAWCVAFACGARWLIHELNVAGPGQDEG